MTGQECVRWQGDLAMHSISKLEPEVAVGLRAHLDGCAECREQAAELASVADSLRFAAPAAVEDPEATRVPPRLQESVLSRLEAEAGQTRRRSRRRVGVVASLAAGIAAAVVVVASVGSGPPTPTPSGRIVALTGAPGTAGTIMLVRSSSGTNVTLREHGQPVGRDFVVTMESTSGKWWQAGSYHTSGTTARAQLTCAVQPYEITRVWVRDSTGVTVLSGYAH